jgi:hypothetical protein
MPLPKKRLEQVVRDSLSAAVLDDLEAVDESIQPLFNEGTPLDAFRWVVALVAVAERGAKKLKRGHVAQPFIATVDPVTGHRTETPIDQAPPGVAAYARIRSAWANDTPDIAMSVWGALLESGGEESGELERCMSVALTEARDKVRAKFR